MSASGGIPPGGPGGVYSYQGELWSGDPRNAPGLARPVGWRVREPDGTAAYDKFGTGDMQWVSVGSGSGGSGITDVDSPLGTIDVTDPSGPTVDIDVNFSFEGVTQPIGARSLGTQEVAARVDHQHPFPAADGINTGAVQLATDFDASAYTEGAWCWVASVGGWFQLHQGALATDGITVVNAFNLAGFQWVRTIQRSIAWEIQPAWFIDPIAGSDEGSGTTNGTALKTLAELSRRLWSAQIKQATTVTILGNVPSTDTNTWLVTIKLGISLTIGGSLGATTGFGGRAINNALYSGAVTGFTAASAVPAADDIELVDAAITGGSFTAAGLLAEGVLFESTSGAQNGHFFWGAKDLGGTSLRITPPAAVTTTNMSSALAVGTTYVAFQLWTCPLQNFGAVQSGSETALIYDKLLENGTAAIAGGGTLNPGISVLYRRSWFQANRAIFPAAAYQNCAWTVTTGVLFSSAGGPPAGQLGGGLFRNTSASNPSPQVTLFGVLGIGGCAVFQGCGINVNDGVYCTVEALFAIHDTVGSTPMILTNSGGRFQFNNGGGLSGKGNSTDMVQVLDTSSLNWSANALGAPPFVAGSTSVASPVQVRGHLYAVASLPTVGDVELGTGVNFPLNSFFTTPANGAVVVAMTNAPTGSPAAPARYVAIPDGVGGFLTIPSLT